MEILWFISAPDGRYPWSSEGSRKMDLPYFRQLAIAVDNLGFSGALFATAAHDVWVLGATLIPETERMKFLLAVHPGLISPTLLAKMASTFDEFSKGRLIINVVNGESKRHAAFGLHVPPSERYALSEEYFHVWQRVISGETVTFKGAHIDVQGAKIDIPSVQKPWPPLWFSGSSEAALKLAAKQMDSYLTWGEPPAQAGEKIAKVRQLATEQGRTLRYGVRLNVIVRETDEEAWQVADWLLDRMDPAALATARKIFEASDSVGQQRMHALHGGNKPPRARDLEIYPNLWAGLGLIRPGAGTALVGSPDTVAARLHEYREQGFDTFILSGLPLLEEAHRVAELLLPRLPVSRGEEASKKLTWGQDAYLVGAGNDRG